MTANQTDYQPKKDNEIKLEATDWTEKSFHTQKDMDWNTTNIQTNFERLILISVIINLHNQGEMIGRGLWTPLAYYFNHQNWLYSLQSHSKTRCKIQKFDKCDLGSVYCLLLQRVSQNPPSKIPGTVLRRRGIDCKKGM